MGAFLSGLLLAVGAFLMLVAALGVVRMPDLFMRMHASTKATSLGVACLMLGLALHFNDLAIWRWWCSSLLRRRSPRT
jgi:multicomponent Na+:H+ antiporter subunit G